MNYYLRYAGLMALAAISAWLAWHYLLQMGSATITNPANPDQYLTNLTLKMMDDQGQLAYQFSSPKVWHYQQNNRTVFLKPIVIISQVDQPPWRATADQGQAWQGDTRIDLQGHVQLQQTSGATNPATQITTTQLQLFPSQHLITTAAPILLRQPPTNFIESTGLQLTLRPAVLVLSSQVKGEYLVHDTR